ncbi:DNA topoisomerase IB [soil metagenome]
MSANPGSVIPVPAGLIYVSDDMPGIARLRKGKGFAYRAPDGQLVKDQTHLERIRKLAIPPAYERVWICPLPNGHVQATGRDARGRKQYRYHAKWRLDRDANKFSHLQTFGAALPRIRSHVSRVLASARGAPTLEVVLATLVRLLDTTMIRVGNDEYARTNNSFGLTTLRDKHAQVRGDTLNLSFKGKSGVQHNLSLEDPRVARVVRRCQAMPGQELFQYLAADGTRHGVGSAEVNDYLRSVADIECTAKDFRTWHASVHALELMRQACQGGEMASFKANQVLAVVAKRLGNTMAVCRKAYVHPQVLALAEAIGGDSAPDLESLLPAKRARLTGLTSDERRFLAFLETDR